MNGWTVCRRAYRQQHKQHKPRKQINQKITKTPIRPTFPKQALKQDTVCNSQCLKTWQHLIYTVLAIYYTKSPTSLYYRLNILDLLDKVKSPLIPVNLFFIGNQNYRFVSICYFADFKQERYGITSKILNSWSIIDIRIFRCWTNQVRFLLMSND
jgi:hypothetical protein